VNDRSTDGTASIVERLAAKDARVRAVLRRRGKNLDRLLAFDDVALDRESRQVTRAGRQVELTPREFELLPLMDGKRSVKELVIAYYQRNGVLALSRVGSLVSLLRAQHLLAGPSVDAYARLGRVLRGTPERTWSGEWSTSSVDGLFESAYQAWGHLFFHRVWLGFGVLLGLAGPLLVVTELLRGRYALYDIGGWGALTTVVIVVLTLLALAFPFVLTMLGVGLWISTRAATRDAAMQLTTATIMPSVFLSGYVFPLDSMPPFFYRLAQAVPTTWLIDGARVVIRRGAGWAALWQHALVLWGMAIGILGLITLKFHKRL